MSWTSPRSRWPSRPTVPDAPAACGGDGGAHRTAGLLGGSKVRTVRVGDVQFPDSAVGFVTFNDAAGNPYFVHSELVADDWRLQLLLPIAASAD